MLFILTVAFVLGLVIGSFANVVIARLPAGQSVVSPPSRCPKCLTGIRWYDNIPLLSYALLRARCRNCGEPISLRYPAVELLTGLLFTGIVLRYGLTAEAGINLLLAGSLVIISFIDLDHRIIPNVISLPGMVVGLGLSFLPGYPAPVDSVIGLLAGGGFLWAVAEGYLRLTGREGMGFGDVKLLGMIGAFLGWQSLPVTVLFGSLTGAVAGVSYTALKGGDMRRFPVPFGPFLAAGALVHVFFGWEIILWYIGTFQK